MTPHHPRFGVRRSLPWVTVLVVALLTAPEGFGERQRSLDDGRLLPLTGVHPDLLEQQSYKEGDYLIVPDYAGRVFVFRVMGYVFVHQAIRLGGEWRRIEWVMKRGFGANTPLDSRFKTPLTVELLSVSLPLGTVEEARGVIRRLEAGEKQARAHVLDKDQAIRLEYTSVIRMEFLRLGHWRKLEGE
jgi:hypothetical protein